jgi:hypothetical protein
MKTGTDKVTSNGGYNYKQRYLQGIEGLILDKFPDIPDLKVEDNNGTSISVQFSEGRYTKEEVELFLNGIKTPESLYESVQRAFSLTLSTKLKQ